MSLDLALAPLYLPRFAGVAPPAVPIFSAPEEAHFARGVALFTPAAVTEAQVAAIAGALRRGRARVRGLATHGENLSDIAREAGLSPARRNELALALRHRPAAPERFFARTELFWLGWRDNGARGRPLPAWGAPTLWMDGCLCVRMPPVDASDLATAPAGRLASRFADLRLALAEAVDELALPARIVGDLLPLAMRELLDGAGAGTSSAARLPSRRERLAALVRGVHDLPRERIEDYVAALVGEGRPLRPVEATAPEQRP